MKMASCFVFHGDVPAGGLQTPRSRVAFVLGFLLLCSGCTVRLISSYDEVIDQSATELQKKIEGFILKMESSAGKPEGSYEQNAAFYDDAKASARSILIRAEAQPKNDLTIEHAKLIEENIEILRKLHEGRGGAGLPRAVAEPAREALDTQFRALLTLELAKKRGE